MQAETTAPESPGTRRVCSWAGSLLCLTFVLHASLGEWFYKTQVLGAYLTEVTLIVVSIAVTAAGLRLKEFRWLVWFAALGSIYVVTSLASGRERYWVLRQSTFVLYLLPSAIFYFLVKRGWWDDRRLERLWRAAFWIGLGLQIFHFASKEVVPGCGPYASTLLFSTGVCYYLDRISRPVRKIAFGLTAAALSGLLTDSSTGTAALCLALFLSLTAFDLRRLVTFGSASVACLAVALPFISGANDPNATWRYAYWTDVLIDRFHHGLGLLGKGFGIQYLPEGSQAFDRIIAQVSNVFDRESVHYQLMTVPPHNSVLEIWLYLGLPGVLFFLYPYAKSFASVFLDRRPGPGRVVLLQLTSLYCVSLANQGMSVPYGAPYYWSVIGVALGMLGRRPQEATSYGSSVSTATGAPATRAYSSSFR